MKQEHQKTLSLLKWVFKRFADYSFYSFLIAIEQLNIFYALSDQSANDFLFW